MKIQTSIRNLYDAQLETNERLKTKVDEIALSFKPKEWHYEGRVKSQESFALKVESGRYSDPGKMEDFFACWFVVPKISDLAKAESKILEYFSLVERRPQQQVVNNKDPENFRFDDVRLYVTLKQRESLPPSDLTSIVFEIQLKTFLMHAWAIATHDLIYKASEPSWATSRIAYQVRAMLEHAEISIMEAQNLSGNTSLNQSTRKIENISRISNLLRQYWSEEYLPKDIVHLSENVDFILQAFRLDLNDLEKIIEAENYAGRGTFTRNLSPYGIVVQSIMNQHPSTFGHTLSQSNLSLPYYYRGKKVVITPELGYSGNAQGNVIYL